MAAVGDAPADRAEEQQDEAEDDHENSPFSSKGLMLGPTAVRGRLRGFS
jgi:hypothetical protein